MELDHRVERNEEHELLISVALDPVVARTTWLLVLEENPDASLLGVDVEQLTARDLHLICDILIALGELRAAPASTTTAT